MAALNWLDYFLRLKKFARSLPTEEETTPAFSGELEAAGAMCVGVEGGKVAAPAAPGPAIGAAVAAPDGGSDVSND